MANRLHTPLILFLSLLIASGTELFSAGSVRAVDTDQAAVNQLLKERVRMEFGYPFYRFAQIFAIASATRLKYSVVVASDDRLIEAHPLTDLYPKFYRPTVKEILDQIALQTGSRWQYLKEHQKYDSKLKDYSSHKPVMLFEFKKSELKPTFKLKLATGWRQRIKNNSVMYIPPNCPIGLDIFDIGSFSPSASENADAILKKATEEVALSFAAKTGKAPEEIKFTRQKVAGKDALFYQCEVQTRTGYKALWRQWTFYAGDRVYIAISSIFPNYEEKLYPQVKEMLATLQFTD
ncbi:MAG TPA: hypothetical protein PKC98_05090 [Candidatus Melainabacteria bacterium]|nr:hypothetical protein [Candidatus Melainabacteria bacterium]